MPRSVSNLFQVAACPQMEVNQCKMTICEVKMVGKLAIRNKPRVDRKVKGIAISRVVPAEANAHGDGNGNTTYDQYAANDRDVLVAAGVRKQVDDVWRKL